MTGFAINVDYGQFGGGVFSAVEEFRAQPPVRAELSRWIPGPDRPDYALAGLKQPSKYPRLGHDKRLDLAKCDYISYAMISDLPGEPAPSTAGDR